LRFLKGMGPPEKKTGPGWARFECIPVWDKPVEPASLG
jgi:hypothetical protein